ncbi:MAG: enoyl-CoA hydratase/isomerase family protein [Dongiaceae bacterium]
MTAAASLHHDSRRRPRYEIDRMDVLFERLGSIGLITLNRPRALNAVTLAMAAALHERLAEWAADGAVQAVVIRGAGDRAFSAGGDIRALYDAGRSGGTLTREFYRAEYRLNHRIKTYGKPYVALIDGIVMGGGVGVSIHGSHRVVSERCRFAMPETGIGFFPDVGATWFLPRCPGEIGMYLGLTGERIGAADMIYCGLATHHVPSERFGSLIERLGGIDGAGGLNAAIRAFAAPVQDGVLADLHPTIDRCFSAPSIEQILARLAAEGSDWSNNTADILRKKSPTSLKAAFRQLRLGARLTDFAAAMAIEYRICQHLMAGPDFHEGVRAVVIDKDQAPRWQPASLAQVGDEAIDRLFAPLGEPDLRFS